MGGAIGGEIDHGRGGETVVVDDNFGGACRQGSNTGGGIGGEGRDCRAIARNDGIGNNW